MKKDVIYIDNDDEIASITDKVENSKDKIVALVLPKRCTVLQSSVNMKILFKSANNAGKQVVLITSEAALLPLAGAAGVYVAKTLQTKPAVPEAPEATPDVIESVVEGEEEPVLDETKSIGELAGDDAADDAPIELGDDEPVAKAEVKEKKDKKLKVPNFDTFRKKLFLGIGIFVLLIGLWIVMTKVLPRATVTVVVKYENIPVNFEATGSASATSTDTGTNNVPSAIKSVEKTDTKTFQATGQKDNGTKATGNVSFSIPCSEVTGSPVSIPSGTGVSTGGLTFITQETASLTSVSFIGGCKFNGDADVTAQSAGDQYNISANRTFSVNGFPAVSGTNADAMGGGTSKIVKVVSQADCDAAKTELLNAANEEYKTQLQTELTSAGMTPVVDSFTSSTGAVSCSPAVNQEASEATATVALNYTMIGVSTEGMNQIITKQVTEKLGTTSQTIYDTGLATGKFTTTTKKPNGDITFTYSGDAKTGVKQDAALIQTTVAGKKYGESLNAVRALPGVSDVTISYSPFWVQRTPTNTEHITVKFSTDGN